MKEILELLISQLNPMDIPVKKNNKASVRETLFEYPGVAWISREEDIKLSQIGYQTERPGGFLKCYDEAGIK